MRLNNYNLLILIVFSILSISLEKLGENSYYLGINKENNPNTIKQIGNNGTIGLITNDTLQFLFNDTDPEIETNFTGTFYDENGDSYEFDCRLMNRLKSSNLIVLCTAKDFLLTSGSHYKFDNATINYRDSNIYISPEEELYFQFEQFNDSIPFIYSDPQYIDLNTSQDYYELNFAIESSEPENLALTEKEEATSFTPMNNCTAIDKELRCQVKRERLEEIFTYNTPLALVYLSKQGGIFKHEFVLDIRETYNQP